MYSMSSITFGNLYMSFEIKRKISYLISNTIYYVIFLYMTILLLNDVRAILFIAYRMYGQNVIPKLWLMMTIRRKMVREKRAWESLLQLFDPLIKIEDLKVSVLKSKKFRTFVILYLPNFVYIKRKKIHIFLAL